MGLRERFWSGMARQLGEPKGWRGRILGRGLNRGNRAVITAAVLAVGVQRGDDAADLGFGGGAGLQLLLDRVEQNGHVYGVDLSAAMLQAARRRFRDECSVGRMTLHQGSMLDLPLTDDSLDAVITVNTVYFVDDLAATFAEVSRTLRPGGRVAVGIGDPEAMASMPHTGSGFRLRPLDEIRAELEGVGLKEVRHERVGEGSGAAHLLTGQLPFAHPPNPPSG